jgi:hypothetical protein
MMSPTSFLSFTFFTQEQRRGSFSTSCPILYTTTPHFPHTEPLLWFEIMGKYPCYWNQFYR